MYLPDETMKLALEDLSLSNSFSQLGEDFFARVQPSPFRKPARLVHYNHHAGELLDLHPQQPHQQLVDILSGQRLLPGSDPIAMLYAGHQFGHYVPQLGDGRAIMLGETRNRKGEAWEIQLKGSGHTPFSRDGDGRAVLRSTIREYLCSEAMHGLGIPTTRALCITGSDEEVYREQIETGAMLTRLAPSHVRFGSFEVFYYRNQFEQLEQLADYVVQQHYPELANQPDAYVQLLDTVIERTAALIAQWQGVGFCHGVMNSDNMSILGLTIDYGPFGFMEAFDPGHICNHSDHHGRYAYNKQPEIGLFNLSCLAQALLPLLHDDVDEAVRLAQQSLKQYESRYVHHYAGVMRNKLGLQQAQSTDQELVNRLLNLMAKDRVDFTIAFRKLCDFSTTDRQANAPIRDLFLDREAFDTWAGDYSQRLASEPRSDTERAAAMKQVNPKFILRNYMAEIAIRKAEDEQDYSEIDTLLTLLHRPFDEHPEHEAYAGFPPDWAGQLSVSCSS